MSQENSNIVLIRAYVREGITRWPIDLQKWKIQQVADEMELRVEWYVGTKSKKKSAADERDLWARQTRRDELAMCYDLQVCRLTRKQLGGIDPKADFAGFMAILNGRYIMEAESGLTSKDKAMWRKKVTSVAEKPPPGTKGLTSREASEKAKHGWKTRNRGVVAMWTSEARAKERKHLIRHWLASKTAATAHTELPQFIEDMGGGVYDELKGISPMTLSRIVDTKRK